MVQMMVYLMLQKIKLKMSNHSFACGLLDEKDDEMFDGSKDEKMA